MLQDRRIIAPRLGHGLSAILAHPDPVPLPFRRKFDPILRDGHSEAGGIEAKELPDVYKRQARFWTAPRK